MKMTSSVIEMACERIRVSVLIRESGPSEVTDMTVGTIREKDTAITKDDRVFVIVLSNVTFFLL